MTILRIEQDEDLAITGFEMHCLHCLEWYRFPMYEGKDGTDLDRVVEVASVWKTLHTKCKEAQK